MQVLDLLVRLQRAGAPAARRPLRHRRLRRLGWLSTCYRDHRANVLDNMRHVLRPDASETEVEALAARGISERRY